MKFKFLLTILLLAIVVSPLLAQVSTRTGSIFGKVVDEKGTMLPGVTVTLESAATQPQTATTGTTGGFRFANLPPGTYSITFAIEGFTEVRQEDVQVNVGGSVQLDITLKPTLAEEFIVVADTPVVDTKKTGNDTNFNREYLDKVPSGRDPWVIIEQTPGIDTDRVNIAGSESGQQSGFFARGTSDADNVWNYDGVNTTDPLALGATPTYYDFDAFEEISIESGGMDASIATKGVVVNLVTKRAGNKWEANASYYFVNESLQSDNTPQELLDLPPIAGQQRIRSNRIDQVYDWGFDIGGPVVKDRLFLWGAYRRNQIDLFTRVTNPFTGNSLSDKTTLEDLNFKANFNANPENESQFGYFNGDKNKSGRGFNPPIQAEETLWEQHGNPRFILEGIWTGQHTYIPNDRMIVNGRYGYIGNSFDLAPNGGNCRVGEPCEVPIILLAAIPRYEDTSFNISPISRPSHDVNADLNWFKENWGGDHEFKFGFEYKTNEGHTFSSYGNGALIIDYYQSTPNGPLIGGYIYAQRFINGTVNYYRTSAYATDTWRKNRLTLNVGVRIDSGSGKNQAASIPAPAGFDQFISGVDFAGNDRSKVFTNVSPRLGATYDLTDDGKTIFRGNYARYYDGYTVAYDTYANPTYSYNGVILSYTNANVDRVITPNEVTGVVGYYGGAAPGSFDQGVFDNLKRIGNLESPVTDEVVLGVEREVIKNLAVFASFTHRTYDKLSAIVPFGVTADDYVPAGVVNFSHPEYGTFSVPYSDLAFEHDGTQLLTTIDGYTQTYNGLDIGLRKRMSDNFMLNGFLTLQRQRAHYDGGNSFLYTQGDGITARDVYADPLIAANLYDDQAYAFVSTGSGKTGVFPYAEWTFRMSGVYQLPWDLSAGAFVRYQQGFPKPLFAEVASGNLFNFYANGRLIPLSRIDEIRYDNIFTLDFNVQKVFELSNYGRITLAVDVFNATNENTVIQRERRTTATTFNALQENLSPRAVRLGFKYSF